MIEFCPGYLYFGANCLLHLSRYRYIAASAASLLEAQTDEFRLCRAFFSIEKDFV